MASGRKENNIRLSIHNMDEAINWRQHVQLIPSPRKVLAQELDMFKGQMSIIDRNSDLIRRNDRTSCIMTRQNKNYKHMFGSPSEMSSNMRLNPSQRQVAYSNNLDQRRELQSNSFAKTGRYNELSMFAPPTQESTQQNNKLSLRTNNYRDKNSEPYRFTSTRNSLQFDRTQDGISRSSFSQYDSMNRTATPSQIERSPSQIYNKKKYKVDFSRNIVDQMTSKIAETPIQQRKLQKMGFKGMKMQQYVNNSQLIIHSSMSPSRFDSSQLSKSEIDRSKLDISVSEIRAPSPTMQKHSKFMTQKEKDSLWIQEQRNFMIHESQVLEQANNKIREEMAPKQGEQLQAMNVVMDRDKLPPLQDLESKGETLQKRIKNYNQNLSAIETPILDQIQGQVQKIKFELDVFNRSNSNDTVAKVRSRPLQKKSSMSISSAQRSYGQRKLLSKQSMGSGLSQVLNSSMAQETESSLLNLTSKVDTQQETTRLSPRSILGGQLGLTSVPYSDHLVKSKMAIFFKGKMADHNIRALSPIKALSKKEIMERLEQHQAKSLEKAMMRGTKMYGKTGGVSIEQAEQKQRENIKWQEDVINDRQMDLLVYNIKDEAKKQHKHRDFMLSDQFDNILDIQENMRLGEILQNAARSREANLMKQEMFNSKESFNSQFTNTQQSKFDLKPIPEAEQEEKQQFVDKLSMLKFQKKSDSEKKKDFMRKHKKLLSYIDRLNESILKPVTNTYKKQRCLNPKDDPDKKEEQTYSLAFRRQDQHSFNEKALQQQAASLTSCLQTDDSIVEEELGIRNNDSATFLKIFDNSNTQSEANLTIQTADRMQSCINLIQTNNNNLQRSPRNQGSSPLLNLKFCDSTQKLQEPDAGQSEIQEPPPLQLGLDLQDSVAEQYLNEQNAVLILNHSREKQTGKVIGQIKDEFVDQLKLINQKRKYVTSLSKRAIMNDNPVFCYFQKCMQEQQLDMPVFEKMRESSLIVRQQVLTAGHCLAIKEGCKIMNTKELAFHHVLFESNSLGDTEFKIIAEALNQVKMLKRIEIKNNIIGLRSMSAFQPLLYRNAPYQLRELRLIDCGMIPAVTCKMFEILAKHCTLESLLVQKAHYNQDAVNKLCDIIKSSRCITTLDIAGSDFNQPQKQYCQLLDAISLNRRLVNLNLEWNNLGSAPSIKIVTDPERQKEIKQEEILDPKEKKKHDPSIVDMKMHIALCLVKIIKYSKKLQHLNLENTGLTLEMARVIVAGLRKSMSLQSLHLSNNPFLRSNQNFIEEIRDKIRAKDLMKRYVFMSDETMKGICQPHNQQELIHLQSVNTKNNILKTTQNNHVVDAFWNNQLILQRKLNHKHDIKGIGQWDIISDRDKHEKVMKEVDTHKACWICSNQIYSLIFWSESIQNFILREQHKINTMYLNAFVYNISQGAEQTSNPDLKQHFETNNENYDEFIKIQQKSGDLVQKEKLAHKLAEGANSKLTSGLTTPTGELADMNKEIKKPVIYSNAMDDWHPQTMYTLEEFTKMNWVDEQGNRGYTEPDILKILADRKQLSKNLVHPSMLNKKERRIYDEECKLQKDEFRKEAMDTLLKSLKYQYPQLVNADLAMESIHSKDEPLFVIPVFMQPGKHCMMVSYENNGTVDRTLQTFIVNPRQEKIPDFHKVLGVKKKVEVAFSKKTSVFAAWMPDDPKMVKQCLEENDFLHWRAENFIKDEDELAAVRKFFTKNFDATKEIFINLQGESTQYPGLTKLVVSDFCKQMGLMQTFPHFKQDTSGRQFIASTFVNLSKEQQEHKKITVNKIKAEAGEGGIIPSEDTMIRFQFIEFILRIVKVLYIDTGAFHKYAEGLKEFYADPLQKYRNAYVKSWQHFRDKTLWQPATHDLLHANEDHLRQLYKANCIKPRKHWNFYDSMRFMMSGGIMNLQGKRRKALTVGMQDAASLANAMQKRASQALNTEDTSEQDSSEEEEKPGRPPSFLNMTERQARLCYALSKQTVAQNEGLEGIFKYDKLPYVEFLELLGRIAALRFVGTEFENEPFIKRLEYIVDSSLQVIGATRNEATTDEVDQSESDNEY